MIIIGEEHIGRRYYNAVQNNDLQSAAEYLAIMAEMQLKNAPGNYDRLQVFLSAHLISAIDLSGNFPLDQYIPLEEIIAGEIQRFRSEYSDRPDAVSLLVHRIMERLGIAFELEPFCPAGRMQAVRRYVDQHYSNPDLSVTKLSESFGCSVSYLSRTFKSVTGTGLNDYIHAVRIHHAQELLRSTGLPIAQIAARVGFSSSSAFIRSYRAIEGETPGSYRARSRQMQNFE